MEAPDEARRQRDLRLVEHVRRACTAAVVEGFRDAAISGLCHEGAVEAAVGAVQSLKAEALLAALQEPGAGTPTD